MGGRGSGSGMGSKAPAKQSLDEYLGERGLYSPYSDYMIDKLRIPHGMTQRQQKQFERDAEKARTDYAQKRESAIREYNSKVQSGKIQQPGKYDKLLKTAHGHEDNASVQAARRTLTKRGIDWNTGKKIKA